MTSVTFFVDGLDASPAHCTSPIDLKRFPDYDGKYTRTLLSFCVEGIDEYRRIVCDLVGCERPSFNAVCTGPTLHVDRECQFEDYVAPLSDPLDGQRWADALRLTAETAGHDPCRPRIIMIIRYQDGVAPDCLRLDDGAVVNVADDLRSALATSTPIDQCDVTIIRVMLDLPETYRHPLPPSSMSSTVAVPDQLGDIQFMFTCSLFLVGVAQVPSACWELAQRHLDLRSVNVSGIPMKKSRKASNLGHHFSVAFLYPNDVVSEYARVHDRNEVLSGAVQLGQSQWIQRRQRDVIWSHAPAQFSIDDIVCVSVQMVTPSDLSSPLTLPLMKCVLSPGNYLFFSDSETDPYPSMVVALRASRLYIHFLAANSASLGLTVPPIPDPIRPLVDQLSDVVSVLTVRSMSKGPYESPAIASALMSIVEGRESWSRTRLYTIMRSCCQAVLGDASELSPDRLNDLRVTLDALRQSTIAFDASLFAQSSVTTPDDAKPIWQSFWQNLYLVAETVRRWSPAHASAADLITAALPHDHLTSGIRTPGIGYSRSGEPTSLAASFWANEEMRLDACRTSKTLDGFGPSFRPAW